MDFTKKQKLAASIVVALLAVAGTSFYGGMTYAKGKPVAGMRGAGMQAGQGFTRSQGGSQQGMRDVTGGTMGEVIAKDEKSITVKLSDGGSRIVFYTDKTPVTKSAGASITDVAVGEQVQVTGSANPDGSVSAQSIRLGAIPMMPAAR
jgi:hypothetical protein